MGWDTFYKWGDLLELITDSHGHNSGKHTLCELDNGPVEIVDLPIELKVIFQFVM